MQRSERQTIEIGHRTIIFTILFLLSVYLLWKLNGIVTGLFISFLIMTAVNPLVVALEKWRVPRQISGLLILLLILGSLASGIAVLVPAMIDQTGTFLTQLPHLAEQLGFELDPAFISSQLGSIPQNVFRVISGAFSNVLAVFAVLVVSYYLILERKYIPKRLTVLFGDGEPEVEALLTHIEVRLGGWIRGQIVLCLIIGAAVYVGLFALSIPYAIPLAIIGGVLEAVPNIGPTVSMIPAAIVGFTISPLHGGIVVLLYFAIQQLENYLIVPFVMRKAVGLNPLVTLVSLMIGLKLGGPIGAVLAVPTVLIGQILFPYFYNRSAKQ